MRGLIPNFGHFWKRQYIQLGGPGKRGHLKGYSGNRTVDFRNQIAVYVLYAKNFVPVYVGQAGRGIRRLWDRLNDHDVDHLFVAWEYFSWFGFLQVCRDNTLESTYPRLRKVSFPMTRDHIEGLVITAIGPRMNRQGARWNAKSWGSGEYFQVLDENLDTLNRGHLKTIRDELKNEIRTLKRHLVIRAGTSSVSRGSVRGSAKRRVRRNRRFGITIKIGGTLSQCRELNCKELGWR
jgi:hypothetical protein